MAGGSLITKIHKAFKELHTLGLVSENRTKVYGAQATGCSPIINAVKEGSELIRPVRPNTIAKSLAIGNPADGYYSAKVMRESGGWGESVTDEEIIDAMKLLAETEGIFAETAGGVTLGSAKKLIEAGRISEGRIHRDLHHRQRAQDPGGARRQIEPADDDKRKAPGVRRPGKGQRQGVRGKGLIAKIPGGNFL